MLGGVVGMLMSGVVWAKPAAVLDLSSRRPDLAGYPVDRLGSVLCRDGKASENTVLAAAIVTYGRRPGRSAWGHTSLRFLACAAGQLRDVEYEYYRMDPSIERWFRAHYGDETWTFDDTFLRRQHGALVVVRNERPVDGGYYAAELRKNREIIEAWMPWSAELSQRLLDALDERHLAQLERLRSRTDLDGFDYEPMGTNCTLHVREALGAAAGQPGDWVGSVFPMANLTRLQATEGVRFVVHPSDHMLRRSLGTETALAPVDRIVRPLFRRRLWRSQNAQLDAILEKSEPVIVRWLLEGQVPEA